MQPVCNSFLLFRDSDFLTFKISIFSELHSLHPFIYIYKIKIHRINFCFGQLFLRLIRVFSQVLFNEKQTCKYSNKTIQNEVLRNNRYLILDKIINIVFR